MMRLSIQLILLLVTVSVILVNGAPQLRFEEREQVPGDGGQSESLRRTRRGSQPQLQQLQGAFGHNHQTYHQPAYGHEHAYGNHHQSYGHHQSHGHGHGNGHGNQPIGPVFTFARTDYHGNFQSGVRHKVGGGHYGRR